MHRALVICLSTPREAEGIVEGYATFQNSTKANEYIFVPNATINKRAKRGKYAVHVRVNYKVLATNHGCSLIDIHYSKFARHAPRLALLHLGCVILGDTLYSQRIIKVGEELAVVEPKDLYRVKNQEVFKPKEFYEWVGIKGMRDMGLHPPLFWTVYQTTYPMFGKTKEDRSLELVLRASPPDHFVAMIKLLDFETTMAKFFDHLQTCSDYIIPSNTSGDTKF